MLLAALAMLATAATGPSPGEKVPEFTLPDQSGQPRSLASLQGPKGLVLLFFRSADW
jgi:peroxiredoxin